MSQAAPAGARDAALIGWRALGVVAFVDRGALEGQEFGLGWAAVRSERQQLRIDSQIARDVGNCRSCPCPRYDREKLPARSNRHSNF